MPSTEFNPIELSPNSAPVSPKHRAAARKNFLAKVVVASLLVSTSPFLAQVQSLPETASALSPDTIGLYLSAPMAQGTDVTDAVSRENFDGVALTFVAGSEADCSGSFSIASVTLRRSPTVVTSNTDRNVCFVRSAQTYGGAITDSSIRTVGPAGGSKFMAVPYYDASLSSETERSITFDFPQAVRYVGFWWSAGNAGNIVRFFDTSDTLLAELDSQKIVDILGTSNTSTQLVTREDGGSYQRMAYFGNPRGHNSITPTSPSTIDGGVIFTYLNLYVGGSLNVKKIQFAGPGFEFDNLAISPTEQSPKDSMVLVSQIQRLNSSSSSGSQTVTPAPVATQKADPCKSASTSETVTRKTKTFSGFAINKSVLTKLMKKEIRTWLNKHPEEVCVSVAGFTMGPRVLPTDPKLARDRARSVLNYIKSLRPEASFTPINSRTQRLVGDEIRRAKVTLRF